MSLDIRLTKRRSAANVLKADCTIKMFNPNKSFKKTRLLHLYLLLFCRVIWSPRCLFSSNHLNMRICTDSPQSYCESCAYWTLTQPISLPHLWTCGNWRSCSKAHRRQTGRDYVYSFKHCCHPKRITLRTAVLWFWFKMRDDWDMWCNEAVA